MAKIKISSALGNVIVTEGMTVTEDAFVLQSDAFGNDRLVPDLPTISKDIVDEPTSVTDGEDTSDSA